jgi:hypothetical protein
VDLLLGIDMGTGSSKGVLVDTAGVVLASTTISHAMSLPRPGWAEVDAESMWWREVCEISTRLAAETPPGSRIAAMCVSGVGPCLVLCDDELTPLRPAILYGVDTRATAEIQSLNEEFGADTILERAGTLLSSQAVGPKLEWVRRHEPEVFARATGWYGSNSYVAAKLTGEYVLDHHTASQCDPLYVTSEFDWNTEWAKRICGHLPLPRLVWPNEVVGTVHAEAAKATGIPKGTPVVAGTVDAYSEAFSVGIRNPGDQMLMYGSTMFLVQIIEEYHSDPALWTTAGIERGIAGAGRGHVDCREHDRLAPDDHRWRVVGHPDGGGVGGPRGQRRTDRAAVSGGGADSRFRPQRTRALRGADAAPRSRTSLSRGLRGNRLRHKADSRDVRRRAHRTTDGGRRWWVAQPHLGAGGQRHHRTPATGARAGDRRQLR